MCNTHKLILLFILNLSYCVVRSADVGQFSSFIALLYSV